MGELVVIPDQSTERRETERRELREKLTVILKADEAELVAIANKLVDWAYGLVDRFEDDRAALSEMAGKLKGRDLTPITAELAVEYDTEAKAFEENVTEAAKNPIALFHRLHRFCTGFRARMLEPAAPLRNLCSRTISDFKLQELKKIASMPAPQTRAELGENIERTLSGVGTSKRWVGIVESRGDLLAHVAAHLELMFLFSVEQGELDRFLTRTKGQVALPGVKIEEKFGTRNRNQSDG